MAALAFADSMPDFIVTRTTTRYRGVRMLVTHNQTVMQQVQVMNANTDWQPLDTVSGNIATDHGKEIYSNIVLNGKTERDRAHPRHLVAGRIFRRSSCCPVAVQNGAKKFVSKGRDLIRNRRATRYMPLQSIRLSLGVESAGGRYRERWRRAAC